VPKLAAIYLYSGSPGCGTKAAREKLSRGFEAGPANSQITWRSSYILGMTVTSENNIHEELKSRINSGNP